MSGVALLFILLIGLMMASVMGVLLGRKLAQKEGLELPRLP